MSTALFPSPAWPTLPIAQTQSVYPVHRIFCVGRNYADHAKEMGVEVDREAPFYFTKSALTLIASSSETPYPPGTENYHYEMELVIAIGAPAFRVPVEKAHAAIFGFACGLDMTRRDLQLKARATQRPWDLGKDFEESTVVAAITPVAAFGAVGEQAITLAVDGETKQNAKLSDLVWSVDELVADLSKFYHLRPGDLIFTGTPAGVGAVEAGANLVGTINGLESVRLRIGAPE